MSALLLFAIAAAAGAAGTLAARALAVRVGMVVATNPIVPQHTRPVALLGGVGVAVGFAAALVAGGWGGVPGVPLPAMILGAAAFLAIGVRDDAKPLSPGAKLALQSLAAAACAAAGIGLPFTGVTPLDAALSALWMVVAVNAVNLTDVCDGLVGGVMAVSFAILGAARPELREPAWAAAGACAGFLAFNRPPASVFLGDAGSHLLGFLLAALAMGAARGQPAEPAAAEMALWAGVPLFELAFLVAVRTRKGLPWWRGSPDHFALRLQAAGLGRLGTDAVACCAAAALAGAAAVLPGLTGVERASLLAVVVTTLGFAALALLRWEVPPRVPASAAPGAG